MKQASIISIFILLIAITAFAQTDEKSNCPVIEVIPPDAAVNSGQYMRFSILLDENLTKELGLKLIWTVDKGTIINGQETKQILVSTTGLEYTTITANLEVLGLPEKCVNKYSDAGIVYIARDYFPIDDFGDIANDDIRTRIDNLLIQLQSDPNSTAYIISYGLPKDVRKRENLIRNHIKFRGYDIKRITFKYKGEEPQIRTRLWIIPEGANASELY